jgi:hypothetical protein
MTDLVEHALRCIREKVDDATCERLVLMWNGVPEKSVADIWNALAIIAAQSLAAAREDSRDAVWMAFIALVFGHLKTQLLTESADGLPN